MTLSEKRGMPFMVINYAFLPECRFTKVYLNTLFQPIVCQKSVFKYTFNDAFNDTFWI